MPVSNIWHLFNLDGSPFFQDTLGAGEDHRYPIELFVGREREAGRLLQVIDSEHESRQVLDGPPGYGKTTLVQYVKAQAARRGFLSHVEAVRVGSAETAEKLLGRLLSYVYETVVASGDGKVRRLEPVETARRIVRAERITDVTGLEGGLAMVSGGLSRSVSYPELGPLEIIIPRLLVELMRVARERLKARGIVVHLNDLENLTDAAARRASEIVRDLRRQLISDGYHYILVGTTDAVDAVIATTAQTRSVFMRAPAPLGPLSLADFHEILQRRYEFLRLDPKRPAVPPVSDEAVADLYTVFGGDLRGALLALNEAAHELLGYGASAAAPMARDDVRAVLSHRYQAEMRGQLSPVLAGYFERLAMFGTKPFTQQDVMRLWGVRQARVSVHLRELEQRGYVSATRAGTRRVEYRLAGRGQLIVIPTTPARAGRASRRRGRR